MRILVTVGTGKFDALVAAADRLEGAVVCQIGSGRTVPQKHRWFTLVPDLAQWYDWADIVVTHAGGGTLFEALERGKSVIVVPNTGRTDSHQRELAELFERRSNVLLCTHLDELPAQVERLAKIPCTGYVAEPCLIPDAIHGFLNKKRWQ